jgi:hypothetical protein
MSTLKNLRRSSHNEMYVYEVFPFSFRCCTSSHIFSWVVIEYSTSRSEAAAADGRSNHDSSSDFDGQEA